MNVKKLLALSLVFILTLTSLTACGDKKTNEENDPTTNNQEQEDGKITLKFISWQTNMKDQDALAVAEYQKTHPNIDVVFEYYGDQNATEYIKKVDLMVMGGDDMDIVMTSSYPDHSKRANSKAYYPLDDFFAEENLVPEDVYNLIPRTDGKVYGIPADWKSWFVLINKDHLDEAGLPVPPLNWSWDEYREYAKKLTKGEGSSKRYGSYFHTWDALMVMGVYSTRLDNPMVNPDETFNFNDPNFRKWLEFRHEMENEDKSSLPFADAKAMSANYRSLFFNGEISMLPIGTWMLSEIDDQDKFPHEFVTTFASLPTLEGGKPGRTFTEAHFYSVAANSKHPKEAYDFLRFFTTEGMKIRGMSISAEKGVDKMEYVNNLINDEKYYDIETLNKVLNNPDWEDNFYTFVPEYQKALMTMLLEESELYLLDSQTLDQAIENMEKRAEDIKNN